MNIVISNRFWLLMVTLSIIATLVRCLDIKFRHPKIKSIDDLKVKDCPTLKIDTVNLDRAYDEGVSANEKLRNYETLMDLKNNLINTTTISSLARHIIAAKNQDAIIDLHHQQQPYEEASRIIVKNFSLSLDKTRDLSQIHSDHLGVEHHRRGKRQTCKPPIFCNRNKFRTADGSCNNLNNPRWGKSFECVIRLLDPAYSDGISRPRLARSGNVLPNARVLSGSIHQQEDAQGNFTHMLMQFGQFLDHDISLSPVNRLNRGGINCCPRPTHPECFPIEVFPDDPIFGRENKRCLNFVRSTSCLSCRFGPRMQLNKLTSFIDASNIYGNNQEETRNLRLFNGGLLAFDTDRRDNMILPQSNDINNDQCSEPIRNRICFRAGDNTRVNQHPGLLVLHTIWLRQHNRIASLLAEMNPQWNDERLFQETRRIIGAQMQMINAMSFYKLNVQQNGFSSYNQQVNPAIISEFSSAAFRFGHSLVNGRFTMIGADSQRSSFMLKDNFFSPNRLRDGQLDQILRGLVGRNAQRFDPFCHSDLRNHLYKSRNELTGSDLPAMNIQRGRDHGLPGYTQYLELCFEDKITEFEQLDQYMPQSQRIRFQQHYETVEDIDLFSGGISELPLTDGIVGPTFACIIGVQFNHLKFGDRFYFEHGQQDGSFSPEQLRSIRQTLFSKIICENGDNFERIHRKVFLLNSDSSSDLKVQSCENIPDIDLEPWLE
ncbi:Chorion peroxidase [Sarcoptes scabiei]|uniref:Chorion peroxidase n=1 Tax=Sarcoptes scabiei TaxID=52283 RepID=A0A834R577_SARSC|nr:Chorion peroxidase [Sarcoptes scabiei]